MLCRVSNLPTVWTNVLAAALLSGACPAAGTVAPLALSLSAFYCGGMCLNDLFDREIDARERPSRPLPAGRLSPVEAVAVALALFAVGLSLLRLAPHPSALAPGLMLLAAIVLYDWLHKRSPWTVLLMAACRGLVFAVSAWALAGELAPWVWLAGGAQFLYTLLIAVVARAENARAQRFAWPVIPWMLAGISLLDGALLALAVSPAWLAAGIAGALLTRLGQSRIPGD
jgi:4-hydroxybenzoate polyprenyltransferase